MRATGMESSLQIDAVKFFRQSIGFVSSATLVQRGRSTIVAIIVCATGLLYLPLAHAVPTYIYLYSGNPFDQGPFFDPNDPRKGSGLTMKITSPTPLFASDADQKGTAGLNYWMSDGAFRLQYPADSPPYDFMDPVNFSGSLQVFSLNDGLPTSWNIQLGRTQGRHSDFVWGLQSSYYGGQPGNDVSWDNSYATEFGPMYVVNDPGQWRMYIETNPAAVPELPAPVLFGVGSIVMMAAARSSRRRRT